jgi:hypothetical protein
LFQQQVKEQSCFALYPPKQDRYLGIKDNHNLELLQTKRQLRLSSSIKIERIGAALKTLKKCTTISI